MISWGISACTHDAALAVVSDDEILFASHSERFSGIKNDAFLNPEIIMEAKKYGEPDNVYWYENPYLKATRKLYAGQSRVWMNPKKYLKHFGIKSPRYTHHHKTHAASGYYTSPFESSAILVVDAIGEWTTTSIWKNMTKKWGVNYPASLGLFYSAMTHRIGLKPNEDEYILMGMAAYGDPNRFYDDIKEQLCLNGENLHKGCMWWNPDLTEDDYFDVAAATQKIYEEYFVSLLQRTKEMTGESNLVFMGGCALNCLANRLIPEHFDNHCILPSPCDACSCIVAIAYYEHKRLNWKTPYLGYNIEGIYPTNDLLANLVASKIVGVANGRAEFGPRALGNRSLLADPKGSQMKDVVNKIKKRQEFRPFAPVILQSEVHKYFDVPEGFQSPYMQHVVRCKEPKLFPAIVHKDGTSRVQTVNDEQHSGLSQLLRRWKTHSGHPILLNTSLNIKGEPIVNDEKDAARFEKKYGVKVCVR